MDGTIHPIYILSQILITIRKSHANTSYNGTNLIKDCIVSKTDVTTFDPNNISTLVNKHKLDLVEVSVGAPNAIFVRKVQYSNNTCSTSLIMIIHLVLILHNILLLFVSMIFANLTNFNCFLRL
jgi:hypothetical protein